MLYKTLGCASCHSLDGSIIVGPSFLGLYGRKVKVLTDGKSREVIADDAYIRNSVRTPAKDVAEGFPEGIMPNLSDQINEEQMEAIIAFIKKQRAPEGSAAAEPAPTSEAKTQAQSAAKPAPETETKAGPPDGAALFNSKGCTACHSLDGSKRIGPSLKGIYQSTQKVVTDGKAREVVADETYLRRSIETPNADVVEGFQPGLMPQFGKMLKPDEVEALVTYLKGVK